MLPHVVVWVQVTNSYINRLGFYFHGHTEIFLFLVECERHCELVYQQF